jgi:DNA-binding GntR family transcriptional regulator
MESSYSEQAYQTIREQILRGRLPLGEPLSRRLLALELGMSVIPVTEALQRLENDGLVESRARAGTRVRIPTERDVRESYQVRAALESQSARMFAATATTRQRRELARRANQIDRLFQQLARSQGDSEFQYLVHREHAQLHLFIAECADCSLLFGMIEKNQVLIRNWVYDVAAKRRALPKSFHRDLSATLIAGDPEAADRAMRSHVQYGLEETLRNMPAQPAADWRLPRGPTRRKTG